MNVFACMHEHVCRRILCRLGALMDSHQVVERGVIVMLLEGRFVISAWLGDYMLTENELLAQDLRVNIARWVSYQIYWQTRRDTVVNHKHPKKLTVTVMQNSGQKHGCKPEGLIFVCPCEPGLPYGADCDLWKIRAMVIANVEQAYTRLWPTLPRIHWQAARRFKLNILYYIEIWCRYF